MVHGGTTRRPPVRGQARLGGWGRALAAQAGVRRGLLGQSRLGWPLAGATAGPLPGGAPSGKPLPRAPAGWASRGPEARFAAGHQRFPPRRSGGRTALCAWVRRARHNAKAVRRIVGPQRLLLSNHSSS